MFYDSGQNPNRRGVKAFWAFTGKTAFESLVQSWR
jgi:hypothetical protein